MSSGHTADINFYLKDAPAGAVRVQILNRGQVIRTLSVEKPHAGLNRVLWDLQYENLKPVAHYTPWGSGGFDGPLVLPGVYSVRVSAGAQTRTGSLAVRMDPRSHVSLADLQAQLAFLQRVRADLARLSATIVRLNKAKAKGGPAAASIDALLHRIYEPEVTEGEDALRYPQQVYGKLSYLGANVGNADAKPTASDYAVLNVLEVRARALIAQAAAF